MLNKEKIRGLVVPAQWDQDGRVTSVCIASYDEREYQVEKNPKADALLDFLHDEVVAIGRSNEDDHGNYMILIEEFYVVDK